MSYEGNYRLGHIDALKILLPAIQSRYLPVFPQTNFEDVPCRCTLVVSLRRHEVLSHIRRLLLVQHRKCISLTWMGNTCFNAMAFDSATGVCYHTLDAELRAVA